MKRINGTLKAKLKNFRRRWKEPRREVPYKVVGATSTAEQVEGMTAWYHLNHCTRIPGLRRRRREVQVADEEV